jgi:enolase
MTTARLQRLHAREILDSRGIPTVEVTATLSEGTIATAAVPSGASTGKYEALELRDNDPTRFRGKGVLTACRHVHEEILPALRGMNVFSLPDIDARMIDLDGTPNKSRIGANAMLGVSLACARAGAQAAKQPLFRHLRALYELVYDGFRMPDLMLNVINGGRHADNGLDFQEYHVIPHGRTVEERIERGSTVITMLADLLKIHGRSTLVGDEGGFAPRCASNEEPLELISQAIDRTEFRPGVDFHLAIDAAASEFYHQSDAHYLLIDENRRITTNELIAYYEELVGRFPILSIEDGLAEDDLEGWKLFTKRLKDKILLVGDDLFVTNSRRLQHGIDAGIANAIIIKPNQVGTITEMIDTIRTSQANRYVPILSHRSGETIDDCIVDIAVATNAPYLKAGSLARGERLAKYNRLLAIEEELR